MVPVICHSDWDENWKCYFPYSKTEQKILLHAFVNLHNKIIFYSKLLLITVFYHSNRKTILSYTFNLFLSLFKIICRKYCELLNEHVRSSQRKKLWYLFVCFISNDVENPMAWIALLNVYTDGRQECKTAQTLRFYSIFPTLLCGIPFRSLSQHKKWPRRVYLYSMVI